MQPQSPSVGSPTTENELRFVHPLCEFVHHSQTPFSTQVNRESDFNSKQTRPLVVATPILVDCSSYGVEDDWISISKRELMVFFSTTFFYKVFLPISNAMHVAFANTHTQVADRSKILKSGISKPKPSISLAARHVAPSRLRPHTYHVIVVDSLKFKCKLRFK